VFTYLPLARHDWETALTYSFASILYTLPPVPRLTRYQRRQCILSQRECVLNHIDGDLGLWNTQSELLYQTGPTSFTRHILEISLHQRKKSSSHSSTLPKTAITYFALVRSLTAHSNELIHSELKWMEFRMGECPQSHAPL
jgi:hypothetical protein